MFACFSPFNSEAKEGEGEKIEIQANSIHYCDHYQSNDHHMTIT